MSGTVVAPGLARTPDGGRVACAYCGTDLAPVDGAWKDVAVRIERPLSAVAGIAWEDRPGVMLRHFCCPGCGRLLDTETAVEGEPPLEDVIDAKDR